MQIKQVIKYKRKGVPEQARPAQEPVVTNPLAKNKEIKNGNMDEKVSKAEKIMNDMKAANNVKVLKKDKGLIERTESSKIVLTEDNRQVLND